MTKASVAAPRTADAGHDGRTLASLAFALGLWATILGILNIVYGIGGTTENKMKVVWAAYLSVGQLYPDLFTADMVYRPFSDSVFMILSIGLMTWGGRCLHNSTEGGYCGLDSRSCDLRLMA